MSAVAGIERFVFTVATGRCGQASLTDLIERGVPGCYAAFEEPAIRPVMPGPFRDWERRFRRRFVETHELLGRGRVLRAFEQGDTAYIDAVVARRLGMIRREMRRRSASIYFDVSKFFARGLHVGFAKAAGRFGLVHLVRDPLRNMRSFLNRSKRFALDNSLPDAPSNLLRLDSSSLAPGEFYLWAWCELTLRYQRLRDSGQATHAVEIRTEHIEDSNRMNAALDALGLDHRPVVPPQVRNTNVEKGLPPTRVTAEDIRLFERFVERLPREARSRIEYLRDYDPWKTHASGIGEAA